MPKGCFGNALLRFCEGLTEDAADPATGLDELSQDDALGLLELADLLIVTKESSFIPFTPNAIQRRYVLLLDPEWDGKSIPNMPAGLRELILKGRQFGFSTLIDLLIFAIAMTTPNTNAVVIAHDAESTEKLFRAVRRAYDSLPPHKRATTKYSNKRELLWGDINSTFYVGTAGAKDFGRSSTIHLLHCTEVSKWPDAEKLLTGLLQAVPESGMVWIETTANGFGDYFCTEYWRAKEGKSSYASRFFPWFEHAEYRRDPAKSPAPDAEDLKIEPQLVAAFGVDEWQLAWRRWKKSEPGMGGKMAQEYPSTDEEAFILSGDPYFDAGKLSTIAISLKEYSKPDGVDQRLAAGTKLRTAFDEAALRIYLWPTAGRQYVIAADTAEGLTGEGDHDFDSADVIDVSSWEQVATITGQWDTHDFGIMLADLGKLYNTALTAPERNNHGHAVINAMIHSAHYPQQRPNWPFGLYLHQEYDDQRRKEEQEPARPGWPSTIRTKYFALDLLATAIVDGSIVIRDKETISQLRTYVKLPGGKAGGLAGSHDDKVMSLSIAVAVLQGRPKPRTFSGAVGGAKRVAAQPSGLNKLLPR